VRSGPAPDPNSLRQDRKDAKAWTTLPVQPVEVVPACPLPGLMQAEAELWAVLWAKPQAHMWSRLGLEYQVAHYVRAFLKALAEKAPAGAIAPVLRMEAELGLSTVGMNHLGWKFAEDEVAERRVEGVRPERQSARDRLKAING